MYNAGRSQMAGERIDIFTRGSDPGHNTDKVVVAVMAEEGIGICSEYPKPCTDEIARAADVMVTTGCGDACPVRPGERYGRWVLEDPSDQPIEVVTGVRDEIKSQVEALVA